MLTLARPRKNLRPEHYPTIREMASRGCSHAQIAAAVALDAKTLRERLKDDSAAVEAYADGKSQEEGPLVRILRNLAENGNPVPAMFLLKTRHGYNDREGNDVGRTSGPSVTINLPGPLAPEAYARLIEAVPVAVPTPLVEGPAKPPSAALERA